MSMVDRRIALALVAPMLACGTAAQAAETDEATTVAQPVELAEATALQEPQPSEGTPVGPANKKKWEFATIGYIFFAGAYGKTTPRDPLPPIDLHLPFGTVLKAFKFAFMGAAEARKDRLVFLGDLMWVHLGEQKGLTIRDVNFANVRVNSKTTAITALGGYRVVDNGPVTVDLLAGGRLNGNKQKVSYHGVLLDLSASVSKTWIDPIVATRVNAPLGGKFGMSLYGDMGGFGIGSKFTWQGILAGTYQINHKMTVGLGWRYFQINYHDNDGFIYDVHQTGPILSLRTVF